MKKLAGKRILFIAPVFFGYEKDIEQELRHQGAKVDFLPDRPLTSSLMKAITRFRRELILPIADKFFLESIKGFRRSHYDLIFVVQGEGLSAKTLAKLRILFPKARLVWYLWDSLRNKKLLIPNLSYFDECYTFDEEDAYNYNLRYRPLFFTPGFLGTTNHQFKYHLSFIGTAHSDRYKIISNITAALPEKTIFYWYLYLQASWVYWLYKLTNSSYRRASMNEFRFDPLLKQDVQSVFFDSFAILDIEHPRQTGLTMRTFETLGAGKKLLTTNRLVKNADFYNPNNILVIERCLPKIPSDFFITPYIPPSDSILQKYSIKGWLDEVLSSVYGY